MNIDPQIWDAGKLALSFGAALLIAWLAVVWALRRYKREKAWERRFNAYADALTAMGEMRLIDGLDMDDIEHHREPSAEVEAERLERYRTAKRQLEQVGAVAPLLFSPDVEIRLRTLPDRLRRAADGKADYHDVLEARHLLLDDAIREVGHVALMQLGLASDTYHWRNHMSL